MKKRNEKNGDGSIFQRKGDCHAFRDCHLFSEARKIEPSPFFQLARGFTLIELILVVAVIITLAAIAIPNYSKSKNRAIEKEAISNLKLIVAAERIYKMENNAYVDCTCTDATTCAATGCNYILKLMLNTTNWQYTVATASGTTTAKAAPGVISGCSYTIDSTNFDAEPTVAAGSTCP